MEKTGANLNTMIKKILLTISLLVSFLILPILCSASTEIRINDFYFNGSGEYQTIYDFGSLFLLSEFSIFDCTGEITSVDVEGLGLVSCNGWIGGTISSGELRAKTDEGIFGTTDILLFGFYLDEPSGIFTITSEDITSMLAYVGNIFADAGLLIWVAVGLPLGFYVIKRVIGLIPKK